MADKIVGLRELRENTETYIAGVAQGNSYLVVRRSKSVFRIAPPDDEEVWEPVIDFTRVRKGGVRISDLLARL